MLDEPDLNSINWISYFSVLLIVAGFVFAMVLILGDKSDINWITSELQNKSYNFNYTAPAQKCDLYMSLENLSDCQQYCEVLNEPVAKR